jgi:ArsR family metal-binding transcriptional regulator
VFWNLLGYTDFEGRNIGFWPRRIAVENLASREQAREVVERLVGLVNQVWEKHEQLEPDTTTHKHLQPLELYQLLPRTNCRACGEETCFNFALKLVAAQTNLERCTPLYEKELEAQRGQLETVLATSGLRFRGERLS